MNLTQREKMMLGVLLGVLLLWLEYTFVLKGQLEALAIAQDEQAVQEIKLEQLNNAEETDKKLDQAIASGMGQIALVLDKYFTTTEQEETILLIHDLLAETGVDVSQITYSEPEDVKVKGMPFRKMTAELRFSGQYEGIFSLMKKTWDFQKAIVIDPVTLSEGENGVLDGAMKLNFYYLVGNEGTGYKDNLYQMIIDESFFKGNPFTVSPGASDFRLNYIFIGGKEPGTEAYTPFADIAGHWAEKEINDFGEKGYIIKGQDANFNPDAPMTRGEFVIMLDRIYQWPVPDQPVDMSQFTDYGNLGSYENAMAKAVLKGLLGGYVVGFTDNTLRPRDPITYEEMEFIIKKIRNDEAFTWRAVGERLQTEKGVVSVGLGDLKQPMSKAETVYLMSRYQ